MTPDMCWKCVPHVYLLYRSHILCRNCVSAVYILTIATKMCKFYTFMVFDGGDHHDHEIKDLMSSRQPGQDLAKIVHCILLSSK